MNASNQYWSIPVWITSRSYFAGTEKARTIITNSKWWMHLVLVEISSDLWSVLPKRFNLESLRQPLENIGIDLNDTDHRQEVEAFLLTLQQDGVLVTDSEPNPAPSRILSDYLEESRQVSSVAAIFNEGLANEGILASAFFELTYRCNQNCVHCFNPRSTFDHSKDLTTDEIIATLAELEAMGTYCVTFSGGEVSLRDDFFEIMREAQHRNFAVSVFTNGQASSDWIEKLITFFPQTIGVSLYSANPETHDATTQRKGSFEQSVRTIETLVKHGIRTTVKCPGREFDELRKTGRRPLSD
jgi:sulfatase maturation enzyme AslB (radical SAM superfamily)